MALTVATAAQMAMVHAGAAGPGQARVWSFFANWVAADDRIVVVELLLLQ